MRAPLGRVLKTFNDAREADFRKGLLPFFCAFNEGSNMLSIILNSKAVPLPNDQLWIA